MDKRIFQHNRERLIMKDKDWFKANEEHNNRPMHKRLKNGI